MLKIGQQLPKLLTNNIIGLFMTHNVEAALGSKSSEFLSVCLSRLKLNLNTGIASCGTMWPGGATNAAKFGQNFEFLVKIDWQFFAHHIRLRLLGPYCALVMNCIDWPEVITSSEAINADTQATRANWRINSFCIKPVVHRHDTEKVSFDSRHSLKQTLTDESKKYPPRVFADFSKI